MFGKDKQQEETQQILSDLQQANEALHEALKRMEKRLKEQEKRIAKCEADIKMLSEKMSAEHVETASDDVHESIKDESLPPRERTYYLAAPSSEGFFADASPVEQIGKSIYVLTTDDDQTGQFALLDTHDAIATAMISVSQFVKPVCKIIGSVVSLPRHAITEERGTAQRADSGWQVMRKATIRFE